MYCSCRDVGRLGAHAEIPVGLESRLLCVIVSKDLARKLATGRATQLRRPYNLTPLKPQHVYSVMGGQGKPAECRIVVLAAWISRCVNLTYGDALAMGYRTSGDAKVAWVRTHDRRWIKRELVELASAFDDGTVSVVDWILVKRFDEHWADRLCQVVTVKRVMDEPRFMADQRRSNAGQYTRSAARSIDPVAECVDAAYQERLSAKASEDGEKQRVQQRIANSSKAEARRLDRRKARLEMFRRAA